MKKLIKKINNFSHRYNLWQEGDRIVAGISGGPDSACLLDILVLLAKKKKFKLLVAHVNYGLRGKDSDGDEKFVRNLAEKYGLRCEVMDAKEKTKNKVNEKKLREIRYAFFEKVRKKNNFDLIAVAHNQDDQAETVLMRMFRGSGSGGLSGIRPLNDKLVRPLLALSREEISAYLKEKKLRYRIDKTNRENIFLRNRIRNKLIPLLEKEYNPVLRRNLAERAEVLGEEYDFLLQSAEKVFRKIKFSDSSGSYYFGVNFFEKIHPAMQRQVLRMIILKLRGNLLNIERGNTEEILKIIKSAKNKSQKLFFGGLKIERKGDIIYISIKK
ncbi:MAG: tRNA lysidine(34) synthetase TilS [Candidatus Moraniibacteriota bacterium]